MRPMTDFQRRRIRMLIILRATRTARQRSRLRSRAFGWCGCSTQCRSTPRITTATLPAQCYFSRSLLASRGTNPNGLLFSLTHQAKCSRHLSSAANEGLRHGGMGARSAGVTELSGLFPATREALQKAAASDRDIICTGTDWCAWVGG